jgi:hypothetical protein
VELLIISKKTKPLSEAQKEAVCIVNMIRGIKIFSLGSEPGKIVATWAFNNLARDGISVVPVPQATSGKNYKGVKKP